mmetsp:Transcript_46234/g.91641  ORF Transcript_46234/g.91641 Transcript_46234/m.91641 type:complete len:471 (+) Transcript_46234:85-1497(+)
MVAAGVHVDGNSEKLGDSLVSEACGIEVPRCDAALQECLQQRRRRNLQLITWINFGSTITMRMIAGPFLDIYLFKISGSNHLVGAVESVRGIVQLLAAPVLGLATDRFDRYKLIKVQAALHAMPTALMGIVIACNAYNLLFLALPLYSVSCHFGDTARMALLADNVEDGLQRTRAISRNFSMQYVGQAVAPLLQFFVLLAVGYSHASRDEHWQLPELRRTLLAGSAIYLIAEPASLLLRVAPPTASAQTATQATNTPEASRPQTDWRQERVMCCGSWSGLPKMWATPVAVEVTFFLILLGSGMSTKFYPLFFATDFGLSPLGLCMLQAAEPLGVAALTRLNPLIVKRLGRAQAATLFMAVSPILLLGITCMHQIALVAPIFVLRTATARAYIPLFQAIVATCVPSTHRGKFAALNAVRLSFFSANAFLGAMLADAYHSYRPAFVVTAIWQLACIALFIPVLVWLPRHSDI